MIYFLFRHHHNYPDVRRLSARIGAKVLIKRGHVYQLDGRKQHLEFFDDIAVRWGGRFRVPIPTINSPEAVCLIAHKSRTREVLQGKVPVPKTWWDVRDIQYPCIARPSQHSGGKNFIVLNSENDLGKLRKKNLNGWYYSELLEKKSEWRIYVGHGKVLGSYKKELVEDEIRANRLITRSQKWEFIEHPPENIGQIAVDACHVTGIDTSGVDVLVTQSGDPKIIELNSTPTLSSPEVEKMYEKYFKSFENGRCNSL